MFFADMHLAAIQTPCVALLSEQTPAIFGHLI
jgi:hypothetical protein